MNAWRWPDPVLVVDDDPDARDMLVEYLQFKGFNVHEASDGGAAIALASTLRPRVILMDDLAKGDLDGLETTRRLRANASTKHAIIVALMRRALMTDRNAAHRAGCEGFISKPFDLHTLAEYIDRLVGKVGRQAAPHTVAKTGPGRGFR